MKNKLFTEQELIKIMNNDGANIRGRRVFQNNPQPPVFICVLNGAFMFFTELIKSQPECIIDFIRPKSYKGKQQNDIKLLMDIEVDIENKDIYVIDDIIDSGKTMNFITQHLYSKNPKSITPVTLFKKHYSNCKDLIWGAELEEEYWLTGFGLDSEEGTHRNLPYILGELIED